MSFFEIVKAIFTDRVPGEGYFAGAEGFIRMVLFIFIAAIGYGVYILVF